MRDFTKVESSNLNGLIAKAGAIKLLVEFGATSPEIEEIKPRHVLEDETILYRIGDLEDFVNDVPNEFQDWS